MSRYLPIAIGALLIVGLTIVQARMTDRLSGTNITADQKAELLKKVPMNIGDWKGQDKPVDERIKDTAGAVGAVSRTYHNSRTNETVDLWLIVGHGRSISAHTPDICYRSSGFTPRNAESAVYSMETGDGTNVPFLTNTFFREDVTGRRLIRVFWTWFNTENEESNGEVIWEAPTNARWRFGNTRALYKMYFTSEMRDQSETAEQSPCLRFAREALPVVDKALSEVYGDGSTDAASSAASDTPIDVPRTNDADGDAVSVEDSPTAAAAVKASLSDEEESAAPAKSTEAAPE